MSKKKFFSFSPIINVILFISLLEFVIFHACVFSLFHFEHLHLFQAFYLAVITVFTVGYGDIYPHTFIGKQTVILLLITGVGYVSFVGSMFISFLIEGNLFQIWGEFLMKRKLSLLKDHVIVCGLGRAGNGRSKTKRG